MAEPYPIAPIVEGNSGWVSPQWARYFELVSANLGSGSGGGAVDSVFSRTGVVVAATNDYTWAQINKATSSIADITSKSHTLLTDKGTNTHPQIDTHIASTSNPHAVTEGLHEVVDSKVQLITALDLSFLGHKAVAMVSDGGPILPQSDFVDGDVNTTTEVINVPAHMWATQQKVRLLTTGVLPGGLAVDTDYYTIKVDGDNVKFATSAANAKDDIAIDITSAAGGGTHTVVPPEGTDFFHSPVGRKILHNFDGTEWHSIASTEDFFVFVDFSDGTDNANFGGAVDTGAFKTKQFATDRIPGTVGGNVIIKSNEETYNESLVIQGKNFTGPYSIMYQGTLVVIDTATSATVVIGTDQGTVTDTEFGGSDHTHKLCYLVTDDDYRLVDSHTGDILTLSGEAPSATSQNIIIYDWGTLISGGSVAVDVIAQKNVSFHDIAFESSGNTALRYIDYSSIGAAQNLRCKFSDRYVFDSYSNGISSVCLIDTAQTNSLFVRIYSFAQFNRGIITGSGAIKVACNDKSTINLKGGIVEGGSSTQIRCLVQSSLQYFNQSGDVLVRTGGNVGATSVDLSVIIRPANVKYSGGGTDESPAGAAVPSYIE